MAAPTSSFGTPKNEPPFELGQQDDDQQRDEEDAAERQRVRKVQAPRDHVLSSHCGKGDSHLFAFPSGQGDCPVFQYDRGLL